MPPPDLCHSVFDNTTDPGRAMISALACPGDTPGILCSAGSTDQQEGTVDETEVNVPDLASNPNSTDASEVLRSEEQVLLPLNEWLNSPDMDPETMQLCLRRIGYSCGLSSSPEDEVAGLAVWYTTRSGSDYSHCSDECAEAVCRMEYCIA